jgi:hypothetical protein
LVNINVPQFDDLRLISGPNYYKGSSFVDGRTQAIENITFTVVPLKTGTIRINPLTINFNKGEEKTDEITINVIPQPQASFNALSTYTDIHLYAPPSKADLDKLIEENLFVRVEVDKHICFLGEAITATFKLYSRLQSTSEVINAPSLYGFSVMDMLDINEAHQAVETIGGKVFNTSVLRKLQLYPAQTGTLTIDAMQLQNSIEFDDTATKKKIKVEKLLESKPVEIVVNPLPSKQPAGYTGAVGQFALSAHLSDSVIAANAQGKLTVTISGKGNFIQFGPPVIQWPKEFDVFDSLVSDELNKSIVPTAGKRKYVFSFSTGHIGDFTLPPISFSFFDPSSGKYKEVTTGTLKFAILPATASKKDIHENQEIRSITKYWIVFLIAVTIVIVGLIIFRMQKRKKPIQPLTVEKISYVQKLEDIIVQQSNDKEFCSEIQKLLNEIVKERSLSISQRQELRSIQEDCQLLIYSNLESKDKKEELQKRTEALLKQLLC